jgi:predicted transcriptional regulator
MKSKAIKTSIVKKSVVEPMYMTRIPNSDLTAGYVELSDNAFKLLTYFYSKGDGWEFNIDVMTNTLKLTKRTVMDRIKELKDKGFLLHSKGGIDVYIVGKKLVGEYT